MEIISDETLFQLSFTTDKTNIQNILREKRRKNAAVLEKGLQIMARNRLVCLIAALLRINYFLEDSWQVMYPPGGYRFTIDVEHVDGREFSNAAEPRQAGTT
ncbi:hypothetical protein TNCV_4967761 [Trichonephila clavipes]|nr:hypothetical protein TNCV_4967761 [Trichonephila clavipes]